MDFNDYELNDVIFQDLGELWDPHSVDRFACSYNAKLPRFNPRWSETVVAFCREWGFTNNWLSLPVYLIFMVIKRLELCHARGALIVPRMQVIFLLEFLF